MKFKTDLTQQVMTYLHPSEAIVYTDSAVIQQTLLRTLKSVTKRSNLTKSAVATALLAPIGLSLVHYDMPKRCWIIVTHSRLLLFEISEPGFGLGPLLWDGPISRIDTVSKGRIYKYLIITDTNTGQPVIGLNFGFRQNIRSEVAQAIAMTRKVSR